MTKRLERMRENPSANWSIDDVVAVCREYEVRCEAPRGGGSHYRIGHPAMARKLTIPYRRPIKPPYIRDLVRFLDEVASLEHP